jgi:type VI secretion system Hcp family effector
MKTVQRPLWYALPVAVIVGIALLAAYMGGPRRAMSAPTEGGWPEIRMYLWVEGIEGECEDALHKGYMEVLSYQHEIDVLRDANAAGTHDEPRLFQLTVTRPVNKVSPLLFAHCCQEVRIPTVTLELWYEGAVSQKVMTYTGHDAVMASIRNLKSATADSVPTEEMTFVCAAMEWNCTDYDAAGRSQGEIHAQCGSPPHK